MTNNDNNTKKNKIIPKVIESFQRAIPKKYANVSKKASIQTLYRNTNSNLGKNVPDHRLMKELLQNYDEESIYRPNSNKTLSNNNHNLNIMQRVGTVLNKTVKTTTNKQDQCNNNNYAFNQSGAVLKMKANMKKDKMALQNKHSKNMCTKGIDKMTSTTGLNIVLNKIQNTETFYNQLQNAKYLHQELEEYPTKDVDHSIDFKKLIKSKTKLSDYKKNTTIKVTRQREKSFVKEQVEKLNKISNNKLPKTHNNHKSAFVPQNKESKSVKRNIEDNSETVKDQSRNYLNLMQSVRRSVPRIGRSGNRNDEVGTDLNEWSDHTTNTDYARRCVVKFPKETKYAMDQLREKNLDQPIDLTVLSKFGYKNYDQISPIKTTRHSRQYDGMHPVQEHAIKSNKTFRQYPKSPSVPLRKSIYVTTDRGLGISNNDGGSVDKTYNKVSKMVSGIPVRRNGNRMYSNYVPCWKNLLCDRGDHKGPCN